MLGRSAKNNMRLLTTILAIAISVIGCSKHENDKENKKATQFQLDIPESFTLVDPIPEGDEWLKTFKEGNGYKDGWETWIWRLTDINMGANIRVYARNDKEKQFLVTGCSDFTLLSVDFNLSEVGSTGYYSSEHNVKLTPSKKYIVCLAENPRSILHGLPINDDLKANKDWVIKFVGSTATWKKPNN